ncbi:hypothetical protein MHYP_G00255180 [Metynnis hypsauchen]
MNYLIVTLLLSSEESARNLFVISIDQEDSGPSKTTQPDKQLFSDLSDLMRSQMVQVPDNRTKGMPGGHKAHSWSRAACGSAPVVCTSEPFHYSLHEQLH